MADVVRDAQQEFWRPPAVTPAVDVSSPLEPSPQMAHICTGCGSEFMIAARYCHSCGDRRTELPSSSLALPVTLSATVDGYVSQVIDWATVAVVWTATAWRKITFPAWLRYLHFHEIKRQVGLPTGALIAFLIGLGCVAGAIGVSLFYKASNLVEFQAIQMWRIEWLLAATASFVAGILLKRPDADQ
jgi:hypothetical protein